MTENCSLDQDVPLTSLPFTSASRKWCSICPEGNLPPPPLNLLSKLGDDLLIEILIRLPNARSSFLCKSVCKPWIQLSLYFTSLEFCSESGKWSQRKFDDSMTSTMTNVVLWNGELFWLNFEFYSLPKILFACNPFRLDRPLRRMIVSHALWRAMGQGGATLAVSQGAMHIVVFEVEGLCRGSRYALSVWRLEEDDEH
ncbi:unnamed protein product [Linum tenue]|uniref:F-box domain-containing protein n=1 Tax=Linum tenue TaxID=586396 RepID=A0AAV0NI69_9ROSI|nr:unnamed protein product [Linum tenue]